MKAHFLLPICCILMGSLAIGCRPEFGLDAPTRDQIQKGIDELALQPSRWEQVLSELIGKIGGEARETIVTLKDEMTDFSREVIEDTRTEARCNADYIPPKCSHNIPLGVLDRA